MCGIYLTNIPFEQEEVKEKLKTITFRGPNNLGYERIDNISLGHLRLSILDLDERANQPYRFNDLCVVYNGEIYNFKEIRSELVERGYSFETTSDTEVLVKGYAEWGSEVISKLNGMFAFAIYDSLKKKVFCGRDRLGVKPFFYYWKDGFFEICSQLHPIINENSVLSSEAVSIYLDCGYIPSPFSILKYVYKLPPGKYLEIDEIQKVIQIHEYWNLDTVKCKNISYNEAKDELHSLLQDAVKIRMQSDVPIGSFLSGGIDSALVTSIASNISETPINTFSIGFDDAEYDESKIARKYAEILGTQHTETICNPKQILQMLPKLIKVYDEPFADSSALPSLLLNSITSQFVTVALSGDGGDESFLGYVYFGLISKFSKIAIIPLFLRKLLVKIPFERISKNKASLIKQILSTNNSDDLAVRIFTGFDGIQNKKSVKWLDNYRIFRTLSKDPIQRAADLNIKLWLENDSNVKVDRASMAYSVEVRSPFLDYRIIEYARNLPISYRFKKGKQKRILRDILKSYIPEEVFNQPKKGFSIPLGKWIREDLKGEIMQALNEDFFNKVPNLNIEKFKKQLNEHFEEKRDHSFNIWKLFILSKWYDEFFSNR